MFARTPKQVELMRAQSTSRLSLTVEKLQRSSALLRLLIDDLRELLEEPPDRENARWMLVVLDKMLENLEQQFELEEQQGYLADVLEQFPSWHPHVEHLRQQHALLHQQLREVRDRLAADRRKTVVHEMRRHLRDWIQAYEDHERRERDLIQEAFTVEPGAGD